ncbi:MAG: serine hydrolase [Bacteroidetes bacterium]|nr:serine hydrolase [Bacteroidota bacterium]
MRFLVLALLGLTLFSSCTLGRRLFLNAPGYSDQFRFDHVAVQPAPEPFHFKRPTEPLQLGQKLKVVPTVLGIGTESMQAYLRSSATQAFLIIRNDTILYEGYFNGHTPEKSVTSFSVAKTFVGSLVALAISEGSIGSMEDKVQRYLPDFPLADISIRHLLNHTSGIHYPLDGWQYYSPHLDRIYDKGLERRAAPGQTFRYENGNTQVLSMVLEAATGQPVESLLSEKIWSKIGTEHAVQWSTDDNGTIKAFCCMNSSALDFAKFGRLMARQGDWDGQQLIPREFFSEGSRGDTAEGQFIRYKNHMWLEGEDAGIYMAAGLYGQYLYVYPPKNIIIVRFARENIHLHAAWSEFFQTIIAQL